MPQTITASGLPVGEQVATYTGWQACATTTIAASGIADGRHRADHAEQALGLDVAVDCRHACFPDRLARVAEDDVDLSFDNVGGRQLTLALSVLRHFGSVVLRGSISSFASRDDPDAGADVTAAVPKRATLRGDVASDHYAQRLIPIQTELEALLRAGHLRAVVSQFEGLPAPARPPRRTLTAGRPYRRQAGRPNLRRVGRGSLTLVEEPEPLPEEPRTRACARALPGRE